MNALPRCECSQMPMPDFSSDNKFSRASSNTGTGNTAGPAEKFQIRSVISFVLRSFRRWAIACFFRFQMVQSRAGLKEATVSHARAANLADDEEYRVVLKSYKIAS